MREALVTFLARSKKAPGTTVKVRFPLDGTKAKHMDLSLRVLTTRPAGGKLGHLVVGTANTPEDTLPKLADLLDAHAQRPATLVGRRSPRLPISLRVMARELPGFGAVTVDLSQHGVRLNCHGILRVGMASFLTIESDTNSVDRLQMRARVVWSSEPQEKGKGYLAGLEFVDMDDSQAEAVERYWKGLWGRLRGDVMHRQIADGAFTVREVKEEDVIPQTPGKTPPPAGGLPGGLPKGPPPPPTLPPAPPPPPRT